MKKGEEEQRTPEGTRCLPEEKPKLDNAEVRVYGIYVIYVIASDEARASIFEAVEGELKK